MNIKFLLAKIIKASTAIDDVINKIGTTDISEIGDGTLTGAVVALKDLVDVLPKFDIELVDELPTTDISSTTIYLVLAEDSEEGNLYSEYIYYNNKWELLGTQSFSLDDYYTKTEVDNKILASAADDITEQEYVDIFNNTPPLDGANEEGF